MWLSLGIGVAVFYLLHILWQCWSHRNKPFPWISVPLLGDTLSFYRSSPSNFCLKRHHEYGNFTRCTLFGREVIMISDPDGVAQIFAQEGKEVQHWMLPARALLLSRDEREGGPVAHTKHLVMKKELLALFNSKTMPLYFRDMQFIIHQQLKNWVERSSSTAIPLNPLLSELASAIIYGCLIDKDKAEDKHNAELCEAIVSCFGFTTLPYAFPGTALKKALKAKQELKEGIKKLIGDALQKNKKEKEGKKDEQQQQAPTTTDTTTDTTTTTATTTPTTTTTTTRTNLVEFWVEMKQEVKEGEHGIDIENNELVDNLLQLLLEGYEGLTKGFESVLELLGNHPTIYQNVETLVHRVSMEGHQPITYKQIQSMVYVDAVVKEILRMNPPIEFSLREVISDDEFLLGDGNQYKLSRGDMVMLHYPSIHTAAFTAPDIFDPDRFDMYSDTFTTLYAHDNRRAFYPFAGGSKGCPGTKFAMLVLHTFVAALAKEGLHWKIDGKGRERTVKFSQDKENLKKRLAK